MIVNTTVIKCRSNATKVVILSGMTDEYLARAFWGCRSFDSITAAAGAFAVMWAKERGYVSIWTV